MIDKCPICLEELVSNIGVAVPCGHCFHRDCFARLKEDSEQRAEILEQALLQQCCLCKKKVGSQKINVSVIASLELSHKPRHTQQVRKFHNIYISFHSVASMEATKEQDSREERLRERAKEMEKRVFELQALSADQSEILCRLVPRHDHLEARNCKLKEEKTLLKRQLKAVEDENWDLRFDAFDATAKFDRAMAQIRDLESKLEAAAVENRKLLLIGDTLEGQLEAAKSKRKSVKEKMRVHLREHFQQIDTVKQEMERMKKEKDALKGQLAKLRPKVRRIKEMRLTSAEAKRAKITRCKRLPLNLIF